MKHVYIVNPESGQGEALSMVEFLNEFSKNNDLAYEIHLTKYKGHATEIASQYFAKDNITLYSVGGDGTLYEILQGINNNVPLAIIPCGSGNDFFRTLHIDFSDIHKLIEDTINGKYISIDIGQCLHNKFINCTSVGLDAEVVDTAVKMIRKKQCNKKIAYFVAALKCIANPKGMNLQITIDDKIINQECLLVSIMNGQYYGGGFNPTPDSDIQDGYLNVIVVEMMSKMKMYRLLPKYLKGKHTNESVCKMYKCKRISIKSDKKVMFESDGECYLLKEEEINILPKKITIQVPISTNLY